MKRIHRSQLFLIVATVALAGCSSTGPEDDDDTPTGSSGLRWVTYEATGEGGDGAEINGVIQSLDGCLALKTVDNESGDATLLAFSTDDQRPASLDVEDEFSGTGGEVTVGDSDDFTIPSSCGSADTVLLVNSTK